MTSSLSRLKPVLLTGGTGYIGSHLRKHLAETGTEVTLLLRPGSEVDRFDNETVVPGDVTDPDSLSLSDTAAVVHLAAFTDVNESLEEPKLPWVVNATGTANLLETARDAGVEKFLHVSTARVYGPPEYLPIDESHPRSPTDPYGSSKLAAEAQAFAYEAAYDLPVVVARPFNSFGCGLPKSNVAAVIADQLARGEDVELKTLSPSRDFLHVSDVVAGLTTILADGEPGEAYNVGRGEALPVGELAEVAIDVSDRDARLQSTNEDWRDEEVAIDRSVSDSSKLRALGWEPDYSIREGLREFLG